ncbi:ribbon-helix-helix protein, CopG family [Serratia ficaria]|uniref:ribbon-helix-helix protein, CopG family n=1 Tax=Serratia ficaria TaxID=61651 RepID=UPI0021B7590A|nr:ribbon-helix-helix protein, CopG family [Serratia ficaria]
MAQSITDIQKRSDERRGLKVKSVKLSVDTIALLEKLAADTGNTQATVITEALRLYEASIEPK